MLYSIESLKRISGALQQEISQAAKGQTNSLAFAKNPLPTTNLVQENQTFQVIMMGGSHLESALVKQVYGVIRILHVTDQDLPLLENREIVCQIFTQHLKPDVEVVCLNFAYPLQAVMRDGYLDGRLTSAPKQHNFTGLLGQNVGQILEEYVLERLGRKIKVTVCNDTTALALASLGYSEDFGPEQTMVGVIGTGFNFGLFENETTFVNLESGNFNQFDSTPTGQIIDRDSSNPGLQLLEKEVGGAYLASHYNLLAKESDLAITLESSKEVSQLATRNTPAGRLAQQVLRRSASLVAAKIVAIYSYQKAKLKGDDNFQMLAMLEGSLYWKGHQYRQYVDEYLNLLGVANKITIVGLERMGLIGVAKLAIR